MLTGRRFRLELTSDQERYAEQIGSCCRAVWNIGLEQRREYRRRGAWIDYVRQAGEMAAAKADHPWLADPPGHCLQQTLMDLDRACRVHGTFKIRWRSARRWSPSFRFPDGKQLRVERLNGRHARVRVKLPKLGWARFRLSRPLDGLQIRSATVKRSGRHWYVSFLVDDELSTPLTHSHPEAAIGVDRGVACAVATSDGRLINRSFVTPGEQRRSIRLQRKLARAQPSGSNRSRTRDQLAEMRSRERRRRMDFCAQTAHELVTENALVVVEDLRTKAMTKSATGTRIDPGSGVRQKAGLNRAILSKGWHQFALALSSAGRYTGSRIVTVPPYGTSQRCSSCGHVDPRSRESQARFRCVQCQHVENADVNAAKNILAAGHAVTACGDLQPMVGPRSRNQQETARKYCFNPKPFVTG
jgi:putative transposase